jgi:prevent-host-death family protein
MLILTPQIEPITTLARDHRAIVAKIQDGPVFLAQRSRPAAVVISPTQWDELVKELRRLQRIIEADRHFAEVDAGHFLTQEQFDAQLAGD